MEDLNDYLEQDRFERQNVDTINQRIFDTSLDLILVTDKRGTVIRISPSAKTLLGYDPDEVIGQSARRLLHPDDLDNTRAEMRAARRGRQIRHFECRYIRKNGTVAPLAWTGVWSQEAQQHFFIGRDMTERKAIEEQLRRAQRLEAVGQLTGGVAHDFNNLLAVIIGNLGMAQSRHGLDREDDHLVGEAMGAAKLGAELVARLLAFSRQQQLQPRRVEINELVHAIAGLLGRTLGEQITISLNLADGLWPALIDAAQLEACLVNLATNARDAMPKGGRLMIATANRRLDAHYAAAQAELAPGDYVMIEVGDTGEGMAPEVLERAFEPFFTTKEPGKGTGLGLSMIYGFAKQSGGHVNVYSEPGKGTTFRLYLPRDGSAEAAAAPTRARSRAAVGGTETVLVVEDNVAVRHVVRLQLKSLGYGVIEAENAAAALEVLERKRVALVLSDIVMPGGVGGAELARETLTRWPGTKVVLTSGFPEAHAGIGGGLAGVRLLAKPYDIEELAGALRDALDAE